MLRCDRTETGPLIRVGPRRSDETYAEAFIWSHSDLCILVFPPWLLVKSFFPPIPFKSA